MNAWERLVGELRAAGPVARAGPGWVGLIVDLGEAGAWQKVRIDLDRDWLVLRADVCREDALDPRAALAWNDASRAGALAVRCDIFVLRQTLPLGALDGREVLDAATRLGRQAAQLRETTAAQTLTAEYCLGYAE